MTVPRWLSELLTEATDQHWCNQIGCTTCGALDFRFALATKLCERASVNRSPTDADKGFVLSGLPLADFKKAAGAALEDLAEVRLEELARFDSSRHDFDMGMIFSELRQFPQTGELADHYRRKLDQERAAEERRRSERKRRVDEDRARVVTRRITNALDHAARSRESCAKREIAIKALEAMSSEDRLIAVAEDRFGLPIEAIPLPLLEGHESVILALSPEVRKKLINRIDRRRGQYGAFRRALEAHES